MEFTEPFLLWGAVAVVIPVAIHFWHQKRGKPLPWAATRWLTDKNQQQSRGLRLDNIPLLLVRCLAILLLAFLLSQPILDWFAKKKKNQIVHLVQPNALVTTNFRFELAEAARKGESVFWATPTAKPVQDTTYSLPAITTFNPLVLQTALQKLPPEITELHLYLTNSRSLAGVPLITVPGRFRLHTVIDSLATPRAFLTASNDRKLFINKAGQLVSSARPDPMLKLQSGPAHSGTTRVLLNYQNDRERQTVRAALNALTTVYGLALLIDEKPVSNQPYDWVLTAHTPTRPSAQTLYVSSEIERPVVPENLVYTGETLTPQTSEPVAAGQLPEWLGEQLLRHYGIQATEPPLSQAELSRLFKLTKRQDAQQQAGIGQTLLLLFILTLLAERWLALTKNA